MENDSKEERSGSGKTRTQGQQGSCCQTGEEGLIGSKQEGGSSKVGTLQEGQGEGSRRRYPARLLSPHLLAILLITVSVSGGLIALCLGFTDHSIQKATFGFLAILGGISAGVNTKRVQ
jgi:hypothetical protein